MKTDTETLSAAGWTARLCDPGELSPAERAALTDFLRESPTHVRVLIEHTFIRNDLKALPISRQQLDRWVADARAAIAGSIPFPETHLPDHQGQGTRNQPGDFDSSANPANLSRRGIVRRYLLAAALAGVLAIGAMLVHSQLGLYTTGFGEQRTLTLADGSVVALNTESQMRVSFSEQRRSIALLKGEAFFRVAHDAQRPFSVTAADAVVRAVGTQFNIKIAREKTIVSVVDGAVKVTDDEAPKAPGADPQVMLTKGEEARVARYRLAPSGDAAPPISKIETTAALHAASWTQGRLEFDGTSLEDVLSEFKRYRQFDVEISDAAAREIKLTGSFESHDPDAALAYIATIPGIAVDKTGPHSYRIHRR